MSGLIQNYGFTKTYIQHNNDIVNNEVEWKGDYNGKIANIDININDNGNNQFVSMKLDNNDLRKMFGIQPVEDRIDRRLIKDFIDGSTLSKSRPIVLNNLLTTKKRRHTKRHSKKRKSRRHKNKLRNLK